MGSGSPSRLALFGFRFDFLESAVIDGGGRLGRAHGRVELMLLVYSRLPGTVLGIHDDFRDTR